MRARINVSLTPADRPAVWSRHTQDVNAAARSSFITIGEHGVIAESVAYDLNLALAVHQRRAPTEQL
jgi:hypothetical protein